MKFTQILALAGLAAAVPADVKARNDAVVSDSFHESVTFAVCYEEDYYHGHPHYVEVTEKCASLAFKSIQFYHGGVWCTTYKDTECAIEIQTYHSDTIIFEEDEEVKSFQCGHY